MAGDEAGKDSGGKIANWPWVVGTLITVTGGVLTAVITHTPGPAPAAAAPAATTTVTTASTPAAAPVQAPSPVPAAQPVPQPAPAPAPAPGPNLTGQWRDGTGNPILIVQLNGRVQIRNFVNGMPLDNWGSVNGGVLSFTYYGPGPTGSQCEGPIAANGGAITVSCRAPNGAPWNIGLIREGGTG